MDAESARIDRVRPLSARSRLPVLAIVGRPNVGKSTFFNRLTREKKAIVHDRPGVTRDRNYGEAEWNGKTFLVVDTGGFESEAESRLQRQIQEQSRLAIEEADVVLFLLDGKSGLSPIDRDAVRLLRGVGKPVFFAVNKLDTPSKESLLYEFYRLGLDELFPVSAEHGVGMDALMDRIVEAFPALKEAGEGRGGETLRLAIVGRPNVGKSTLVNRLLRAERSVVDSVPGTTRDAIDSPLAWGADSYVLVDTAGMRRKARIADQVERYSVLRALRSIDAGDVIVHVLDAPEGVTDQDAQMLSYALRRGKGIVLAANKWDLVSSVEKEAQAFRKAVLEELSFVDFAPVTLISAQTGYGVRKLMAHVKEVSEAYRRVVKTSVLNRALQEITGAHAPASFKGRQVKFYYATQTDVCPPTFTLFVNTPEGVGADYERYLIRQMRAVLHLEHSPVRVHLRARRSELKRKQS
jgi:GTP-binding protein